jgi:uncharacterized Tic20 family protein
MLWHRRLYELLAFALLASAALGQLSGTQFAQHASQGHDEFIEFLQKEVHEFYFQIYFFVIASCVLIVCVCVCVVCADESILV